MVVEEPSGQSDKTVLSAYSDLDRRDLICRALESREAIASAGGALATWTPAHSTGRSAEDTYLVRRAESEAGIDWDSGQCRPMAPNTFDMLWQDFQSGGRNVEEMLHALILTDAYGVP